MSKLNWSKARKHAQAMRHGGFEHATDVHSHIHADSHGLQKLETPASGVFSQTHPKPPKPNKKNKNKTCAAQQEQPPPAPPAKPPPPKLTQAPDPQPSPKKPKPTKRKKMPPPGIFFGCTGQLGAIKQLVERRQKAKNKRRQSNQTNGR